MHAVVTGDGPYKDRLSYVEDLSGMEAQTVLVAGGRFPIQRRLGVYVTGFRMRLIECLRSDFPLLRKFVTEEVFDHFAGAYLHFKKPSSYTLFDLGDRFAEFLEDDLSAGGPRTTHRGNTANDDELHVVAGQHPEDFVKPELARHSGPGSGSRCS